MADRQVRLDLSAVEARALLRMAREAEASGFNEGEMFQTHQQQAAAERAIRKLELLAS